jgi:hypothetical protein
VETSRLNRIQRDECLRLLAGDKIGRLAVVAGNTAIVLPVNYALDGEEVTPFDAATYERVRAWPSTLGRVATRRIGCASCPIE